MSIDGNQIPTRRLERRSNKSAEDHETDLEIRGALSELERINAQIGGYTETINVLTDKRNQAYGYERFLQHELEQRREKQKT